MEKYFFHIYGRPRTGPGGLQDGVSSRFIPKDRTGRQGGGPDMTTAWTGPGAVRRGSLIAFVSAS